MLVEVSRVELITIVSHKYHSTGRKEISKDQFTKMLKEPIMEYLGKTFIIVLARASNRLFKR